MANISLRHIYKVYSNGVKAVNDFNMDIEDKEFIVFVGPSGCGKSTTLRMIAGLEDITAGELFIGNTLVNDVEPKDRDIAMVFQNYALYPHMTVYDNMAFGLRLRHRPQEEIHQKVMWAAKVLKLTEYLDRKPKAMSGGQRQRVALGRAILRNPKVFLLDEPLSNLDAKLRTEMRAEISKLHKELNTTFIYVTHDQVEAMTMGTRIVVMKLGYVQQIDTPKNLYDYPANKFVAGFIGTPQMNFFEATLKRDGENIIIKFDCTDKELVVPYKTLIKVQPKYLNGKTVVSVGLRSENISADPEIVKNSNNILKMKISHFEELGDETLIYGDLNMEGDGFVESTSRVIVKHHGESLGLKAGDIIDVAFDMKKAHFFDKKSELSIIPRIPNENVFDVAIKDNIINLHGQEIKLPKAIRLNDAPEAELYIKADALKLEEGNDIEATVDKMEQIGNTKICYLNIGNRTFFALTNKDYTHGEKINIGIDFKGISIVVNEKEIISPLKDSDRFIGGFTDLHNTVISIKSLNKNLKLNKDNAIKEYNDSRNDELSNIIYQESLIKKYKQDLKNKKKDLLDECSYRIAVEEVGKNGKKRIKDATNLKIKELEEQYLLKINQQLALKDSVDMQDEAISSKVNSINSKYDELINKVTSNYNNEVSLLANSKNDIKSQIQLVEQEDKLSLQNDLANLKENYANDLAILTNELDMKVKEAQDKFNEAIDEEKDLASVQLKDIILEKKNKLNELKHKYEDNCENREFEAKHFFAVIDGLCIPTSTEINQKIVKSLGTNLFKYSYKYDVPHDAYIINQENGLKATIIDILDYGAESFAKCLCNGKEIYVANTFNGTIGQELSLGIDISRVRIFENKFDIRLY